MGSRMLSLNFTESKSWAEMGATQIVAVEGRKGRG